MKMAPVNEAGSNFMQGQKDNANMWFTTQDDCLE